MKTQKTNLSPKRGQFGVARYLLLIALLIPCFLNVVLKTNAQTFPYWDNKPDTDFFPYTDVEHGAPLLFQGAGYKQYVYFIGSGTGQEGGVWRWSFIGGWEKFCYPMDGYFASITISSNYMYLGGWFTTVGNFEGDPLVTATIARFNLASGVWSDLGYTNQARPIQAITVDSSQHVYVGTHWDDDTPVEDHEGELDPYMLQEWNGANWSVVGGGLVIGGGWHQYSGVSALATDGTNIFAGGYFYVASNGTSSVESPHVIKWDGSNWHAVAGLRRDLNQSVSNDIVYVNSMVVAGTNLFVAGDFFYPTTALARFSTITGNALPTDSLLYSPNWTGFYPTGYGEGLNLAVHDGIVYVTGLFDLIGDPTIETGMSAASIAYWNSSNSTAVGTWHVMGSGLDTAVDFGSLYPYSAGYGLAANTNSLVVSGLFISAGGVPTESLPTIARWVIAPDPIDFSNSATREIVVPNYTAYSATESASDTFVDAVRSQQVYQSLQFPSGPIKITELRFRPAEAPYGGAFSTTISNIQINLSTTTATPDGLSSTFSANVGPDDTVVYSGPLSISTAYTGNDNGPRDIDIVVHLQTPFIYNPTNGNLLLDIRHFSDDSGNGAYTCAFGESDDAGSRVVSLDPYSDTADFTDTGIDVLGIIYEGAGTCVVPNYAAYTNSPYGSDTFVDALRSQQVYQSLQFPSGPITITELRFRPSIEPWGGAFSTTVSNIQINLSTTVASPDGLNSTFAANVGGDDTVVYSGPLSISSAYTGNDNGPRDNDIIVRLQTPFVYNPTNGNLLLDIRHFSDDSGNGAYTSAFGESDDTGSRVVSLDPYSDTADFTDTGIDVVNFIYHGAGSCIAPNYTAYTTTPGAASTFREAQRSQQVYQSLQFPSGPHLITEMRFRPSEAPYMTGSASATITNIQINLSTTTNAPDGLSTTFADNVGADDTVVYSGSLNLSTAYTGNDSGPRDADLVIHLQTPFLYDPSQGNLLLDIRHFSDDSANGPYTSVFGESDDTGSRVVCSFNPYSTTAGFSDTGIEIVNFIYADE